MSCAITLGQPLALMYNVFATIGVFAGIPDGPITVPGVKVENDYQEPKVLVQPEPELLINIRELSFLVPYGITG